MFMDDLSRDLLITRVCWCVGNVLVNHLFYADGSVLIAPSATALEKLMQMVMTLDITLRNHSVSHGMSFLPRDLKTCNVPIMKLVGKP
jgi:hypothetical protein